MIDYLSSTSCKMCNSPAVIEVQSVPVDRLVATWRKELGLEVSRVFAEIDQIHLLECEKCHLKFFFPDSFSGVETIYSHLESFHWYYMPRKWEHSMALKDLRGLRKVFEVGSGEGHFIERLRLKKGIEARGIDTNERAVQKAQRRGLPVECMDFLEAASKWTNHFDAVCSFQVLEHMPNPRGFLNTASSMLKPGGKLLLGIPNGDSFLKYQFNILDMPPHHLTRWDSRVISYLPNVLPLSIVHVKEEPLASYHVDQYLDAYCTILKSMPWVGRACSLGVKNMVSSFLRRSGTHLLLKGHTLYAAFCKNGEK
jgi:2-polyprenyl-3-methyl-5-hydroxy-6-metoxy-1,4-benzoquinol methylase